MRHTRHIISNIVSESNPTLAEGTNYRTSWKHMHGISSKTNSLDANIIQRSAQLQSLKAVKTGKCPHLFLFTEIL
jgi:hypothetical protein